MCICILLSEFIGQYIEYTKIHVMNNIEYVFYRPVENCTCEHVKSYLGGGGGGNGSFMLSWPRQKMEVSGQLHVPAALPPEKDPPSSTGIYYVPGGAGLRTGLGV
jgi:hypothetical protein